MSSYERALELAAELTAAGIPATADPRSATPPCVLIVPPERRYELSCGYVARWQLYALAPATANADAHKALDSIVDKVAEVLPIETANLTGYNLSADSPPLAAYRLEYEEGLSA